MTDDQRWTLTETALAAIGPAPAWAPPPGLLRIAAERLRHFRMGHDDTRDDLFTGGQLAAMALWYADETSGFAEWPWDEATEDLPRHGDRVADLIRAGALIAAEIDRLLRVGEPR